MKIRLFLFSAFFVILALSSCQTLRKPAILADKPLFRDPIHDGAADPVIVWNKQMKKHVMYYTNRRANVTNEEGVRWVHGTRIGIATSDDGGASWEYLDTCNIQYRPDPEPTYWAPEVISHDGSYHMYLTYVPGVYSDWGHPRHIIHLTSSNGIDWEFQSELELDSKKILDASVHPLPGGGWRLWYNNEMDRKSMYYADSDDLYHWTDKGKAHGIQRGEGAKVFQWNDYYWMFTDEWRGLGMYRSEDLLNWTKLEGNLLAEPGEGADDGVNGQHCDVVVVDDKAYIFYFTHPGRVKRDDQQGRKRDFYELQRSTIQVAELEYNDGIISCDRNKPVTIKLPKRR